MLSSYFYYPNLKVTLHGTQCSQIEKMRKPSQRHLRVTAKTLGAALRQAVISGDA